MTDGKFAALIRRAGGNGINYFTLNQLFALHLRRSRKAGRFGRPLTSLTAIIAAIVWGAMGSINEGQAFSVYSLAPAVFFLALILRFTIYRKRAVFNREDFEELLDRWQASNKDEKLVTETRLNVPPSQWPNPDLYDHDVEKILLVDKDILVDLLVLNAFNVTEKTLVVSVNGYPESLAGRLESVLVSGASELPVFFLHDAPFDRDSAYGLRRAEVMARGADLVDLGFFPEDILAMPGMRILDADEFGGRIPVDAMAYVGLALLIGTAMNKGAAISEIISSERSETMNETGDVE